VAQRRQAGGGQWLKGRSNHEKTCSSSQARSRESRVRTVHSLFFTALDLLLGGTLGSTKDQLTIEDQDLLPSRHMESSRVSSGLPKTNAFSFLQFLILHSLGSSATENGSILRIQYSA
jgi:hypothetical protein